MAYEANSRALARAPARLWSAARRSAALAAAVRVLGLSRLVILALAMGVALSHGGADPNGALGERNAALYDEPALTSPFGEAGDRVLSPLARWDAAWYLRIADSGYEGSRPRSAFFPLYPLAVRAVSELGGASPRALLVAAYLVALAAFLGALFLLHRLVSLELGERLAGPTLWLVALFPAALYFGAPYSESLFLLASVGVFYSARTDRWWLAGLCGAAASATRSAGLVLVLPLAVLYVQQHGGPRAVLERIRPDAAWLLLAPLGLVAYAGYLELATGDGLAFLDVQDSWYRHFAGPLGGAWDGLVAAFQGARQLLSGQREHVYYPEVGGDPFRVARLNLILLGTLIFALVACVGVVRRLPAAYGVYTIAAFLLPLSFPVKGQPLMSLPRFVAVLFPLFMWLAVACDERRLTVPVAVVSALGLGYFTVEFASWRFIS